MQWRFQRQLIVLVIILLPLAVLGFYFISKFFPETTCFDNKQNQDELGVDCGGPCINCALKKPKQIITFWARAVGARQNAYDAAAFIENANDVLATQNLRYEFTLFDDLGLIARREGSAFLYPQEKTYIIEPNIQTARIPKRVEFKMLSASWEVRSEFPPHIVVERSSYSLLEENEVKRGVVDADIINKTSFDFKSITVQFAVFDPAENLLAINVVAVENIKAGARKSIRSIWPSEIEGEIGRIEIKPRVNLFDPTVIVKPQ